MIKPLLPEPKNKTEVSLQNFPELTLVMGGAASGKSLWAEGLADRANLNKIYIATAQAFDQEMTSKIEQHQQRRQGWRTVEAPLDLAEALAGDTTGTITLVDCLTMWLSNHLLAGNDPAEKTADLLAQLSQLSSPIILVSNEVGQSIVPNNALARRFQAAQGQLNQQIAAQADLVVTVMAGLPLPLKGTLPQ